MDPLLNITRFHDSIREWASDNLRSFPWRATTNPFHILMAEVMLRRTQARQVMPVYERFVIAFPDAHSLASAPPDEVSLVLYPLGLAWRTPAFQQIASILVRDYAGQVPSEYDLLVTLPGVGDYVASAVCCFAYGQPIMLADTNTVRVAGRLVGIPTHAESRRRSAIRSILVSLLDREHPATYNYGLLDIAARICTPNDPACADCPVLSFCRTGQLRVTMSAADDIRIE